MSNTLGQMWSRMFVETEAADLVTFFIDDASTITAPAGTVRAWCECQGREVRDYLDGKLWFDATPEECVELLELMASLGDAQ